MLVIAVVLTTLPGTDEVKAYQIPQTEVCLLDTPGFDDTSVADAVILKRIADALVDFFNDQYDIKGALYIHSLVEPRMRGSGRKNLIMFRNVLGDRGMQNCRLVTTKWSKQPNTESVAREQELCDKAEFWQPLLAGGAKTVRFGDTMESAIEIIKPLVDGPAFEPLIVNEVVKQKKELPQTHAGIIVNDKVAEARKTHKIEIEALKAQEEQARIDQDEEYQQILRAERLEHETAVAQLKEAQRILEERVGSGGSGRAGRWLARGAAVLGGGLMTAFSGGLLAGPAALLIASTEAGAQAHRAATR